MAKKALCVGINAYPYDGSDLKGCVNDAHAWAELLIGQFDFARPDVRVLLDSEATKANLLAGIGDLLAGAAAGDVLVFTNSSHGTYVADGDGDDADVDEALCPYDTRDNVLLDDELRERFADLPGGVKLTVISDSCHSGTVTRAAVGENRPGVGAADDRRVRFLHPALRGGRALVRPWTARRPGKERYPESAMREVLLSGCSDREYSYDALIGGAYHGAMTYYALQAIRAASHRITYAQLRARLAFLIDEAGYPQHPQLEGSNERKRQQVFT